MFESFANSKRYKTQSHTVQRYVRLRALLIQKDTKRRSLQSRVSCSLRALLIQKDTKLHHHQISQAYGLRALLIQKDTKL